jgi:uncharacterized protein YcfJ
MNKVAAIILLSLTAVLPSRAQLLRSESVEGALWGGLIGGIAGGSRCHGFSGEGAAIGAGVGLIAGTLIGESRRQSYSDYYYDSPGYVYTPNLNVSFGYGYGSYGSSAYVYYTPNRYCAPGTYYRPTRPNYVVSGTVLGAASGALIGAADHNAGKGAAIGAAAGLVLGGVAEHAAPYQCRFKSSVRRRPHRKLKSLPPRAPPRLTTGLRARKSLLPRASRMRQHFDCEFQPRMDTDEHGFSPDQSALVSFSHPCSSVSIRG